MTGKYNVLGILIDGICYDEAVDRVVAAAHAGAGYAVSALAVHGVMTGVNDPAHKYRLNSFDLVTPDGQPVRWAMNLLWKVGLKERVYGPTLTLKICERAATEGLPVYFYGSTQRVLDRLGYNLAKKFPSLIIAGSRPSKFRQTDQEEKEAIVAEIRSSGAKICFVGLGCPRQEVFAFEYREPLSMPLLAVGAAFDYHAGLLKEPPDIIQRIGLHWLYRLMQEPRRLFKRYLVLNTQYLMKLAGQIMGVWKPNPAKSVRPATDLRYG